MRDYMVILDKTFIWIRVLIPVYFEPVYIKCLYRFYLGILALKDKQIWLKLKLAFLKSFSPRLKVRVGQEWVLGGSRISIRRGWQHPTRALFWRKCMQKRKNWVPFRGRGRGRERRPLDLPMSVLLSTALNKV